MKNKRDLILALRRENKELKEQLLFNSFMNMDSRFAKSEIEILKEELDRRREELEYERTPRRFYLSELGYYPCRHKEIQEDNVFTD